MGPLMAEQMNLRKAREEEMRRRVRVGVVVERAGRLLDLGWGTYGGGRGPTFLVEEVRDVLIC